MNAERYGCIVADPPWDYDEKMRPNTTKRKGIRGLAPYPVMRLAAIAAVPVTEWAAENAHLYVWTTNAFMVEAHDLAGAWGFKPVGILTWVKPTMGVGFYFRNSTEHVVFAVRGKCPPRANDLPTHFTAPIRGHSEKPDSILNIAERMSPGPRLEMFARRRRDGWDVWGDEAPTTAQMVVGL